MELESIQTLIMDRWFFEKKTMSIWKTHDSIWMKPQLYEVGKILNDIPLQFKDFHFRMFLVGSLPEENNR